MRQKRTAKTKEISMTCRPHIAHNGSKKKNVCQSQIVIFQLNAIPRTENNTLPSRSGALVSGSISITCN